MQNNTSKISPNNTIASSPKAERLPWLDFASGIMILWMIIYHAIVVAWGYEARDLWGITDASSLPEGMHAFINSEGKLEVLNPCVAFPWLHFFMPWFFYKSGQFFNKTNTKDLWKKDSQKLLKTFVIWSAVGYVFFLLFSLLDDSITLRGCTYSILRHLFLCGEIPINGPLWFLLTLFGVRFVANKILPERGDKCAVWKVLAVVTIGYVTSYLAYRYNHHLLPYWMANGAAGLVFFALGYAMRGCDTKWWIIVPCCIVYLMCCIQGFTTVDMLFNKLLSGIYEIWIPLSLCGIIVYNALCNLLYKYVQLGIIEYIGRHAMLIYVTHFIIAKWVIFVLNVLDLQIQSALLVLMVLLAYVLFIPIINYILKLFKNENSFF